MKGISIAVLALIAAALFLSFSAFAESAGSDAPAIAVTADGQQKYSLSLASAVADAGDGGSVKLLQDVEINSVSGLAITCSITLDLNGKTISGVHSSQNKVIYVYRNNTLTITDNSLEQTGKVVNTSPLGGSVLSTSMSDDAGIIVLGGSYEGQLDNSKGEIVVLGGCFDTDVSGLVPAGMMQDESGRVVLDDAVAVASVNGVGYVSLRDAVIAANPGGTVKMLKDVDCESWEQVWELSGIVFEGGGHTLRIGGITSLENHDAVFHSAGGNIFDDLTIDLSGLGAPSAAQGFRAFNAANGDVFNKVRITGCGDLTFGIFAGGVQGDERPVIISGCEFTNCRYAVGSEPMPGTTLSSLGGLNISGCTFTGCGYAAILYSDDAAFCGNVVFGGRLNVMHGGQSVTGNSFAEGSRVKFYDAPALFCRNSISADSRLDADENAPVIDVSGNYWGGGAPSAAQLGSASITGEDVYYTSPDMGDGDLSTCCTVTVQYGNGEENLVFSCQRGYAYVLPDAPRRSGFTFHYWSCGDAAYAPCETAVITGDTVFSAVWVRHPDVEYVPVPDGPEDAEEAEDAAEPEAPGLVFSDVSPDAWYYDAVEYVCAAGLMDGVADGTFAPDAALTRAMVWTILARMSGADTSEGDSWYSSAMEWAVAQGISDGEDAVSPITREQFVTMLWRLSGCPEASGNVAAPDAAEISGWATEAMTWAVCAGLVEGDETGAVAPSAYASRAAAAALVMRCAEF